MKTQSFELILSLWLMALVSGCAPSPPRGFGPPGGDAGGPPHLEAQAGRGAGTPSFLFGPVATLLTNAASYEAQLDVERVYGTNRVQKLAGQLKVSGTRLFVAMQPSKRAGRGAPPQGMAMSFVWDAAHNDGFALNEPLQGYAPITAPAGDAHAPMEMKATALGEERQNGVDCEKLRLTRDSSGSAAAAMTVWRPHTWAGVPTRIEFQDGDVGVIMNLTRVQFKTLPAGLFAVPDGFTRYESAAQMADELFRREGDMMKPGRMGGPMPPGGFPRSGPPSGGYPPR